MPWLPRESGTGADAAARHDRIIFATYKGPLTIRPPTNFLSLFTHETTVRVRYAETDQMGYVYYGNYAAYFEVARVEALRSLGVTYKSMEANGVMMPVAENYSKYIRPARYDDLLRIVLTVRVQPATRIDFHYEIFNPADELIHLGHTRLVFVDRATGRPCPPPPSVEEVMAPFFVS